MFIIQIGAADGIHDYHRGIDEVYTLITEQNARAVLIEPNPESFLKLINSYDKYADKVTLIQMAISLQDGLADFYVCTGDLEASTLKEDVLSIKNYHNGKTKDYYKIQVNCCHIHTILNKYGIPDYLVIDAEGYDGDIIESLDLNTYPIQKIRFEFSHINMEQLGRVCLKLIKADYILTHDKADIIANRGINK